MRVEIWGDINCPWCYVGKERFAKALEAFPHKDQVEVVHRSFELDPSLGPGPARPVIPALAAKYGISLDQARQAEQRIGEHAHAEGLEYRGADRDTASTFDMHRMLHLAKRRGVQENLLNLLYRANFVENSAFAEGRLLELAVEAGLGETEAADLLADRSVLADEVREDQATAAAMGATGVPFVVFDRRLGVSGAQPVETFGTALRQAWDSRPEGPVASLDDAAAETCGPEGCPVPG
ncbi:DsbA family oxidoreductase [Streptomyces sp. ZYX-F-203]